MIAVVDYGAGNLRSVRQALSVQGFSSAVVKTKEELKKASGIILPGVGSFESAVLELKESGLFNAVLSVAEEKPILGICLGMQLFFTASEEAQGGHAPGLGLLEGNSHRFRAGVRVPHMGWNTVSLVKDNPLFRGVSPNTHFYFAHSYYVIPEDQTVVVGKTHYGVEFASAVARDNIFGVQFHPEKSGKDGLRILRNFAAICGETPKSGVEGDERSCR